MTHRIAQPKTILHIVGGIALGVTVGIGMQIALAAPWAGPTGVPPANNVSGILIDSLLAQYKLGPLGINTNANPGAGFGLVVGGNLAVGKAYSLSTANGDIGTTLVTKDYLSKTFIGPVSVGVQNRVQGPAVDDFFINYSNTGNAANDNYALLYAGINRNEVEKGYCTLPGNAGRCDGGAGSGVGVLRGSAFGYGGNFGIVRKGEFWQVQHFDFNSDGGNAYIVEYPIGYSRVNI